MPDCWDNYITNKKPCMIGKFWCMSRSGYVWNTESVKIHKIQIENCGFVATMSKNIVPRVIVWMKKASNVASHALLWMFLNCEIGTWTARTGAICDLKSIWIIVIKWVFLAKSYSQYLNFSKWSATTMQFVKPFFNRNVAIGKMMSNKNANKKYVR